MEDQLALMNDYDKKIKIGDQIQGEVLSVNDEEIIVSLLGQKSDGIIPIEELFLNNCRENIVENYKVGDKIDVKVIKIRNKDGYTVLSRLEYIKEQANEELQNLYEEKKSFKAEIKGKNSKGLIVSYKGVRIFVPVSHISSKFTKSIEDYKDDTIEIVLLEYSKEDSFKNIGSRRVIEEAMQNSNRKEVFNSLQVNDIIEVEIKRFTSFGAFGVYKGVDCLIHISEISKYRINSPEELLQVGQVLNAKVITVDKEKEKIALSLKELQPDPWENISEKYPEGSIVLGKVVRITDFGAFVELEPGVDGMVHISKVSYERINHPSDKLAIGDEIKAKILGVDEENKKISLSIRDI